MQCDCCDELWKDQFEIWNSRKYIVQKSIPKKSVPILGDGVIGRKRIATTLHLLDFLLDVLVDLMGWNDGSPHEWNLNGGSSSSSNSTVMIDRMLTRG